MKLLLILLACVASSHAWYARSCFYNYGYNYYCRHNFYILPPTSFYHFNVYFNKAWCTSAYYEKIFKVYPENDCSAEGWTEKDVDVVKEEMNGLLKSSRTTIEDKMNEVKDKYFADKEIEKGKYIAAMTEHVNRYYQHLKDRTDDQTKKDGYETERLTKIGEYTEDINNKFEDCKTSYEKAITDKMAQILSYHTTLLTNAETCLKTRLEKIGEYKEALKTKISQYEADFKEYHEKILEKKECAYRATLAHVHGGEDKLKTEVDAVIQEYHDAEIKIIEGLTLEYAEKLKTYQEKLEKYYACSYRCYLTNACLRFYRKYYYSSCRSIGCWFRFKTNYCVTRYCMNPFSFCWRKVTYKCLKTCDVDSVNPPTVDITKPYTDKLTEVLGEIQGQFDSWLSKWETYHGEYVTKYGEIVKARHDWIIRQLRAHYVCIQNSETLTEEQESAITAKQTALDLERTTLVEDYEKKLKESRDSCKDTFDSNKAEYETKVKAAITSLGEKYEACTTKRTEDIKTYREKLTTSRDDQRIKLSEAMQKAREAHLEEYIKLLKMYHGEGDFTPVVQALADGYALQLINYCNAILTKFDECWKTDLEALVQHYSCCYKCIARQLCFPRFCYGRFFKWTVKYPSACYYRYQYKSYRRTYCYRIHYRKGYYRFC